MTTARLQLSAFALLVVLSGCPAELPTPDAAVEVDAGLPPAPIPCDSPEDCRASNGVCRQQECAFDVPCTDDVECGLGERCVGSQCRFRGCVENTDCPTGFCDVSTFSCAECASSNDCPSERPVCDPALRQCQQCGSNADCQPPGPGFCSSSGRCVACLTDEHCPNGLKCSSGNFCVGAPNNAPCPEGISCGSGLVCVQLNGTPVCLPRCSLYAPACTDGDICFSLTYSSSSSRVFEADGPIGVCFAQQPGLRGAREPCSRTATGSNCQPNLVCMPESASLSLCRPYCDPFASGTCPVGEKCVGFVGDFAGREYGACLPDTGFGAKCTGNADCRTALSCQPWDDPSDTDEVGVVCQFNVGDGGTGAPCAPVALSDGGVISADRACKSGLCTNDPLVFSPPTAPYFCFGACNDDSDCGDAGVCDADFPVSTPSTPGYVRGCRPRCAQESDCARYDAGVTCRVRTVSSPSTPQLSTTCSPSSGTLPAGASCTSSTQCRSAQCLFDDGRGVRRQGVCTAPCVDSATCLALDAGVFPLACQPTALLVSRGFDGVAPTADDKHLPTKLCVGTGCTSDSDCRPLDAGVAVCAPTSDPSAPLTQVVLRCQAPTTGTAASGASCTQDAECASGVCGTLKPPSTGVGRICFEACTATSVCSGTNTCRAQGLRVTVAGGTVDLDACAP